MLNNSLLKKLLIPFVVLLLIISLFFYNQYREQKNESELQSFISIDYYIEHLDMFLSYQEVLIESGFSESDSSEYNARKQSLKLHGESTVVNLNYNREEIDTLREFPGNLGVLIDQFQSAETADEMRTHYEEARELRNEFWSYRSDLQEYLYQK